MTDLSRALAKAAEFERLQNHAHVSLSQTDTLRDAGFDREDAEFVACAFITTLPQIVRELVEEVERLRGEIEAYDIAAWERSERE